MKHQLGGNPAQVSSKTSTMSLSHEGKAMTEFNSVARRSLLWVSSATLVLLVLHMIDQWYVWDYGPRIVACLMFAVIWSLAMVSSGLFDMGPRDDDEDETQIQGEGK